MTQFKPKNTFINTPQSKIILSVIVLIGVILSINLVSAITEGTGGTFGSNTGPGITKASGMKIIPNLDIIITNITKFTSVDAVDAYVLDENLIVLNSSVFVGNNASFHMDLKAGTIYYLAMNSSAIGTYTLYYNNYNFLAANITGEYVNWTAGLNSAGVDDNANIIDVSFITFTPGSASTSVTVSLDYPGNAVVLNTVGINFNVTLTAGAINYTWRNLTYNVWQDSILFNSTFRAYPGPFTNKTNYSLFIDDFSIGNYKWNALGCYANNSFSNCINSILNYTFSIESTPSGNTFNNYVWETSYQPFSINLTLFPGLNFYSSKLIYNGTEYDATTTNLYGDKYRISKSIDVPAGSGNYTFLWKFVYDLGGGSFAYQTTSNYSQNLSQIYMEDCGTTMTLNFSFYNEENVTKITSADFFGTFNYWLGTGTTYKNVSFNNLGVTEKNICINPSHNYSSSAVIQYEKTGYIKRNYYLDNASLTSTRNDISLFFLATGKATAFIISVKDANQLPISGATIYIQRYYPGTGLFYTVAMAKTDGSGNTVSSFEVETEDYRIIIIKNGEVLYTSPVQKVYCGATPCTLPIQTAGGGVTGWTKIGELPNLIYSGPWLNTTSGIITYTYVDTSGTTSYGRLWVYRMNSASGKQTICDVNSTSSAATLTCDVSSIQGTIYAEGYISRSPEILVWVGSWILSNIKSIMGVEGLFWGMIVILILAIGGAAMGGVAGGIVGTILGFIGVSFIGVASFGMITIWAIIILGVFIIWQIKN